MSNNKREESPKKAEKTRQTEKAKRVKKTEERSEKAEKSLNKKENLFFLLFKKVWSIEPVRLATILFLITAIVSGALAFVNNFTYDAIEAQNEAQRQDAMKQVMTDADGFESVDLSGLSMPPEINSIEAALKAGEKIGYCVSVSTIGYGGQIQLMVGVDSSGKVTAFKVVTMSETAGLGTKAKEDPFATAFNGLSYPVNLVKGAVANENEVSAISGATITSKAVTNGINKALEAVNTVIMNSNTSAGENATSENSTGENATGDNSTGENTSADNTTSENGGAKS